MQRWRRTVSGTIALAFLATGVACGGNRDGGEHAAAAAGQAVTEGWRVARRQAAEQATTTTTTLTTTTTEPPTTVPPATVPTTAPPPTGPPVVAADAATLAAQIVQAEAAIADSATPVDQLMALAHQQQVAYRVLGIHPEWDADVLARIPAQMHYVVGLNVDARRQFRSMHTKLSDNLPAWRIIAPPSADALLASYQAAEASYGVAWEYLAAINLVETGMGRIQGLSVAGAQGPMQFMPKTWAAYGMGGDVTKPHDAIMGAANYLRANGFAEGRIREAIWNYNHSEKYVQGVINYASVMEANPRAFYAYWAWEIYYLSTAGDVLLPVGYEQAQPVKAVDWLAAQPR